MPGRLSSKQYQVQAVHLGSPKPRFSPLHCSLIKIGGKHRRLLSSFNLFRCAEPVKKGQKNGARTTSRTKREDSPGCSFHVRGEFSPAPGQVYNCTAATKRTCPPKVLLSAQLIQDIKVKSRSSQICRQTAPDDIPTTARSALLYYKGQCSWPQRWKAMINLHLCQYPIGSILVT